VKLLKKIKEEYNKGKFSGSESQVQLEAIERYAKDLLSKVGNHSDKCE
jgi:hypothetical protein